jgi:hypothetical protein
MSAPIARPEPPRLALNVAESCAALGVSADTFTTHVLPAIRTVRLGRRILIPTTELQAWLNATAESGAEQ